MLDTGSFTDFLKWVWKWEWNATDWQYTSYDPARYRIKTDYRSCAPPFVPAHCTYRTCMKIGNYLTHRFFFLAIPCAIPVLVLPAHLRTLHLHLPASLCTASSLTSGLSDLCTTTLTLTYTYHVPLTCLLLSLLCMICLVCMPVYAFGCLHGAYEAMRLDKDLNKINPGLKMGWVFCYAIEDRETGEVVFETCTPPVIELNPISGTGVMVDGKGKGDTKVKSIMVRDKFAPECWGSDEEYEERTKEMERWSWLESGRNSYDTFATSSSSYEGSGKRAKAKACKICAACSCHGQQCAFHKPTNSICTYCNCQIDCVVK